MPQGGLAAAGIGAPPRRRRRGKARVRNDQLGRAAPDVFSPYRVKVIRETIVGDEGQWKLCFQWCCYDHQEREAEWGYRFIGRHAEGSLQPARGQARLSSVLKIEQLLEQARIEGWGDRDGEALYAAVERLRSNGCVVGAWTGSVSWPNRETAVSAHLTPQLIEDAQLVVRWA